MKFIAKYLQVEAKIGETVRIPYTKEDFENKKFDYKAIVDSVEAL